MTGPTRATRELVVARDNWMCQWCGAYTPDGDLQHRRARMMGGSRAGWINQPGNLLVVHRACHTHIEAHPVEAAGRGFRLGIGQNPTTTPYEDHAGDRWLIDDNGNKNTHHLEETA